MSTTTDKFGNNKLVLLVDLLVFSICALAAARIAYSVPYETFLDQMPVALLVVGVSLYLLSVFEVSLDVTLSSLISRALISVLLALAILLVVIYLLGPGTGRDVYGRGVLFLTMSGFSLYLIVTRYILFQYQKSQKPFQSWIFVGEPAQFEELKSDIKRYRRHRIENRDISWLRDNMDTLINRGVVLGGMPGTDSKMAKQLINAKFSGVKVTNLDQFYENVLERVPLFNINEDWFFRSSGFGYVNDSIRQRVKKTMDIGLVILSAPVSISLFLLGAVLVIVFDKQNPIFVQERIGQHGRTFNIYKLRTMTQRGSESESGEWTQTGDSRVTSVGKFLRQYRIDEIPQLFNVLTGSMSIVGPRPEQPAYTELLSQKIAYYDIRHAIKPGITGWAQVRFPYGASVDDARSKLEYDLYYIKNYSLLLDISILIKTFYTVFSGSGR
ncbi:MAG: sugar transferase [Acidiferrobacterales bacterium]|nr:sugar transferase [Acidiferrobacterales bacterium]